MVSLSGNHIDLRALEPEDLEFLYELENNTAIWEISGTVAPYAKHVLQEYLKNAHRDIYEVKQLRLGICKKSGQLIGLIDLFEFDPKNRRVGIGIVVLDEKNRNKGAGGEALDLVCEYAFKVLEVRQVYANVLEDNDNSIHLFKKQGFKLIGNKKDWILSGGRFKDELLFQKLNR